MGFLLHVVPTALGHESVDLQSRPSSARVLCDLRPSTPSLSLLFPGCLPGGPFRLQAFPLPPPLRFEEAVTSKYCLNATLWDA